MSEESVKTETGLNVTTLNRLVYEHNKGKMTTLDAKDTVALILETISDALAKDGRVALHGFGVFKVKDRKAGVRRNPKTGEPVQVPAKRALSFKAASTLIKRLNS